MPDLKHAKQLYTAPAYDTGFLAITKCGSTFLKNLFWQLNFGEPHPQSDRIHAHDGTMPRGDAAAVSDLVAKDRYFVVVRHPIARFLSVYFDKFQRPQQRSAPTNVFARIIGEGSGFDWQAETEAQHVTNLNIAIEALEFSLSSRSKRLKNPHWAPQSTRVNRFARPMQLAALTVEDLNRQLGVLLDDRVPDLAGTIAEVKARNAASGRPKQALMDASLEGRIVQLYAQDFETWSQVTADWQACTGPGSIPRLY